MSRRLPFAPVSNPSRPTVGLFSFFRRRAESRDPDPSVAAAGDLTTEETTEVQALPVPVDRPASGGAGDGLRWGAYSITGNFRDNNEDSVSVDSEGRWFLVADGLGGQTAGEKASAMAVQIVGKKMAAVGARATSPKVAETLKAAVSHANAEIMALSNVDPAFGGMGTTLVSLVRSKTPGQWIVGSVGDSRVYRLREGVLEQLTTDHSLTQALIDAGTITSEEAKVHRYKNMLVKYLGAKEAGDGGDTREIEAVAGDRFLLCSDGVTDGIDDADLGPLLSSSDPVETTRALVKAAQKGGSRDNITCVVVAID